MRVCKREHDVVGEVGGGEERRAKAWRRIEGTRMRLGRGVRPVRRG